LEDDEVGQILRKVKRYQVNELRKEIYRSVYMLFVRHKALKGVVLILKIN
jgi:hypothetical protein